MMMVPEKYRQPEKTQPNYCKSKNRAILVLPAAEKRGNASGREDAH